MTGRPDAAWGTLAAGERNQVAVLMSLLTHESALAAVQAPPVALDPEGREAAFSYVGAGDARPVFRLEVNRVGVINVDCELEMHPAALLVGGETHEFAPGATVKGSFRCSISPEERRRIAEVDLAHADTADAEAFYNRKPARAPPPPWRLRTHPRRQPPEPRRRGVLRHPQRVAAPRRQPDKKGALFCSVAGRVRVECRGLQSNPMHPTMNRHSLHLLAAGAAAAAHFVPIA